MTNSKLIAKFNETATTSVGSSNYPFIYGCRAQFFSNDESEGGWLINSDYSGTGYGKTFAVEISQSLVDRADAIEYDCYNDLKYAQDLLNLSDSIRNNFQ